MWGGVPDTLQLASVHRYVWNTESDQSQRVRGRSQEQVETDSKSFIVTISPMEIRTWSCFYTTALQ